MFHCRQIGCRPRIDSDHLCIVGFRAVHVEAQLNPDRFQPVRLELQGLERIRPAAGVRQICLCLSPALLEQFPLLLRDLFAFLFPLVVQKADLLQPEVLDPLQHDLFQPVRYGPALSGIFEVGLDNNKITTYYATYWWD